ncbi:MAG: sugar transferase, partial [Lachnospiraceae bacterium]|nr:sugar transferase [Lachnospiraceae bacterium]
MIYKGVKRLADILISLILLIVFLPLVLIVAIVIKADSAGPVIHARVCLRSGGSFRMLKFRSMVEDADDYDKHLSTEQKKVYEKELKIDDDPRITRVRFCLAITRPMSSHRPSIPPGWSMGSVSATGSRIASSRFST